MGGAVVMPLAWSTVDAYARRHGIEGEAFDLFWKMLSDLDAEYLDWEQSRHGDKA